MAQTSGKSISFSENCCVICNAGFDNGHLVIVSKKGVLTLIEFCELRGKLDLGAYLKECIRKQLLVLS